MMSFTLALLHVVAFYMVVTLLHVLLPGVTCSGYACDWQGRTLSYKLNGPLIVLAVGGLWLALPLEMAAIAAENYTICLAAANVLGLGAAFALLKLCPREPAFRCLTVDQKALRERAAAGEQVATTWNPAPARNTLQHFFFGVAFNPRLLGFDLKMLLYALGAAALEWLLLSAAAMRLLAHGTLPLAMRVYLAMFAWFITEYMCLEIVHLYTYDLFCEKLGFKLSWGCLVFYPFFYCIGCWSLVSAPAAADIGTDTAALIITLFLFGWVLTRGANLQKFAFKRSDGKLEHWMGMPMRVVPGTRLLVSGFWGLSRHVNYLGEIVQATALALPGSLVASDGYYRVLPWLYPLYYVLLFVPRQIDDDAQLEAKYGPERFGEYKRSVPYRIVPLVY